MYFDSFYCILLQFNVFCFILFYFASFLCILLRFIVFSFFLIYLLLVVMLVVLTLLRVVLCPFLRNFLLFRPCFYNHRVCGGIFIEHQLLFRWTICNFAIIPRLFISSAPYLVHYVSGDCDKCGNVEDVPPCR